MKLIFTVPWYSFGGSFFYYKLFNKLKIYFKQKAFFTSPSIPTRKQGLKLNYYKSFQKLGLIETRTESFVFLFNNLMNIFRFLLNLKFIGKFFSIINTNKLYFSNIGINHLNLIKIKSIRKLKNNDWRKISKIKINKTIFYNKKKLAELKKKLNIDKFYQIGIKNYGYHKTIDKKIFLGKSDFYNYSEKNFQKSINYILKNKKYSALTLGSIHDFDIKLKNVKTHKSKINDIYDQSILTANAEFYLGTHGGICEPSQFFEKDTILVNGGFYHFNDFLLNNKINIIIYQKIFSIQKKKILSLSEIYEIIKNSDSVNYFFENKKNYIFIENNENEILDCVKEYLKLKKNINSYKIKLKNQLKFKKIKNQKLNFFYQKNKENKNFQNDQILFSYCYNSNFLINTNFFKKYYLPTHFLKEESKKYIKKFNL